MQRSTPVASQARVRFSSADRTAMAAAMIVGIVLVAFFHAPAGAVLGGCSLALAAMFIHSRRKRQ